MGWNDKTNRLLDVAMGAFNVTNSATFHPAKGASFTARAIWDGLYQAVDPETNAVVTSTQPRIDVKLNDLEQEPKLGDRVEIKNIMYDIIELQKDGQGAATLMLHKCE